MYRNCTSQWDCILHLELSQTFKHLFFITCSLCFFHCFAEACPLGTTLHKKCKDITSVTDFSNPMVLHFPLFATSVSQTSIFQYVFLMFFYCFAEACLMRSTPHKECKDITSVTDFSSPTVLQIPLFAISISQSSVFQYVFLTFFHPFTTPCSLGTTRPENCKDITSVTVFSTPTPSQEDVSLRFELPRVFPLCVPGVPSPWWNNPSLG